MMLRNKKDGDMHFGKWNALGGKLIPGETPEECVIREVEEESGLKIFNPQFKGMITFPKFDGKFSWLVFIYVAYDFQGEIIECDEGNLEWIQDEKLLDLKLWEGDKIFMKWLDSNLFFSAKFIYKKRVLKKHHVDFYQEK